ncbi:MAG: DUF1553 domain-containing protein [Planctomycetaceae bacterium]
MQSAIPSHPDINGSPEWMAWVRGGARAIKATVPFKLSRGLILAWILLADAAALFPGSARASGQPLITDDGEEDAEVFFETHVRPVLAGHCIQCHGPEKQSGGLRLDSAESIRRPGESGLPAVLPGDVAASHLIQAIRYDGDVQMPPDGPLTRPQREALEAWVRTGAYWPSRQSPIASTAKDAAKTHWAFQPIQVPPIPEISPELPGGNKLISAQFLQNPIDAFVADRLVKNGLQHSPLADRKTLIRRMSYAVTGLPPEIDEVEAFETDTAPDAIDRLIERLLGSDAYGEHWARKWLDIARYSDTKGYVYAREERFWVHAWSYRDWVVRSLNADLPYDRFLLLQIAADQVTDRTEGDLAAMGFLTLGRRFLGVQRDIYDDRIDVVTRGTMSLTVGCARCHDHKYDPIPTADYYSLYGVFASCRERIVPLADQPMDDAFTTELNARLKKLNDTLQERRRTTSERIRKRIGDYLKAQFELEKYPEEGFDQVISTSDLLPSFVRRWQSFLRHTKQTNDPVFTAWHAWLELDSQRGDSSADPAQRLTLPEHTNSLVADAFTPQPTSREDMIERYAGLFRKIDQQWLELLEQPREQNQPAPISLPNPEAEAIRTVLYGIESPCVVPDEPVVHTEYDFDSGTCNELWKLQGEVDRWVINANKPVPYAVILEDRAVPTTPRIFRRGNPAQKGDDVPRQFLQLLSGKDRQPFQDGSGRFELAQAIIDPQNPLTARVIVNRVWAQYFGQGLVSTPGDFGTRANPPSHPELLDWLANWFIQEGWSLKKLHRLILSSGTFQQTSTGPTDKDAVNAALRKDPANQLLWHMNSHRLSFEEMRDSMLMASGRLDRTSGGKPVNLFTAPYPVRRTLYGLIDRQFLPGTLRMFDFANPDLHIPQRSDTTVPQQALYLMNHPSTIEHARSLASRVTSMQKAAGGDTDPNNQGASESAANVRQLYRLALQRDPSQQQLTEAVEFLTQSPADSSDGPPKTAKDWSYGYGRYDEVTQRAADFKPLPHFTGTAWQGGAAWPDPKLGWVQLTATGGHPGNDRQHASIRRWTAPRAMSIQIQSQAVHEAAPGDGIRVFVVSSRHGLLQTAILHQKTANLNCEPLSVEADETIDFICDIGDVLNSDQHFWRIQLHEVGASSEAIAKNQGEQWNSETDFTHDTIQSLSPLEQLAQVLLCSNEFLFVD